MKYRVQVKGNITEVTSCGFSASLVFPSSFSSSPPCSADVHLGDQWHVSDAGLDVHTGVPWSPNVASLHRACSTASCVYNRTTLILLLHAHEETERKAALLTDWQHADNGLPSHPGREEGTRTVSLAPVRSVHSDVRVKHLFYGVILVPKHFNIKSHCEMVLS